MQNRTSSATIGRTLQEMIDTANVVYRQYGLAMLDRIETKMVPTEVRHPRTGQTLFRPSEPVFGDVTGWYMMPKMVDRQQRISILGELKSKIDTFSGQKTKQIRTIPTVRKKNGKVVHNQVQILDEALTYPYCHVILVLWAKFKGMSQPILATIPWTFDNLIVDQGVMQEYAVSFRKGVWDYLDLLGGEDGI